MPWTGADAPAGSIRYGDRADAPAIVELHVRAGQFDTAVRIDHLFKVGWFLVHERVTGGLAATIHVRCDGGCARVGLAVVAPDLAATGLDNAMARAAEAACLAGGYTVVVRRMR